MLYLNLDFIQKYAKIFIIVVIFICEYKIEESNDQYTHIKWAVLFLYVS